MLFLYFVGIFQIKEYTSEISDKNLYEDISFCKNLDIIFSSYITYVCGKEFNHTIKYNQLHDIKINVEKSVNLVNSSNFNFIDINLLELTEAINIENDTKILFTEFLNMTIIDSFVHQFSKSYLDIWLTMDWEKHIVERLPYCQWDRSSYLQSSNEIQEYFNMIAKSSRWKKICINNNAYYHYLEKPQGEIIIIPKGTMIIWIVVICVIAILILISLYFVALWRYNNTAIPIFPDYQNDFVNDQNNNQKSSNNELNDIDNNESNNNDNESNDAPYTNDNFNPEKNLNSTYHNMFYLFIKQLFGVGNSAGSIISEAIGLFRTFQRISATKSFTVLFSKECLKMFSWATNLFEIIVSNFYLRNFTDIELFYIISGALPLIIILFLFFLSFGYKYYLFFLISIPFAALGIGSGLVKYNIKIAICLLLPAFVIILVLSILLNLYCLDIIDCDIECFDSIFMDEIIIYFPFSFSILHTIIVASLIFIPFFINYMYFLGSYCFICFIIFVLCFIIELIIGIIIGFHKLPDFIRNNLTLLAANLLTLLYIPSTELFINLMNGQYKGNGNCILVYIGLGLLLPISLILLSIFLKNKEVIEKYRKPIFTFYELIDMVRQLAYAFVSAYDITWACLAIEVAWVLAFSIPHVYSSPSEYVFQGGSSAIVISSNIVSIVCTYKKRGFLSYTESMVFVVMACVPGIVALYIFFGFEFSAEPKKSEYERDEDEYIIFISKGDVVITSMIWLLFGILIPVIIDHFKKYYDQFYIM